MSTPDVQDLGASSEFTTVAHIREAIMKFCKSLTNARVELLSEKLLSLVEMGDVETVETEYLTLCINTYTSRDQQ